MKQPGASLRQLRFNLVEAKLLPQSLLLANGTHDFRYPPLTRLPDFGIPLLPIPHLVADLSQDFLEITLTVRRVPTSHRLAEKAIVNLSPQGFL